MSMTSGITFEDALREAAVISYQEEIIRLDAGDFPETASVVVRGKNLKKLSDMITAFPQHAKDALYGRYCFDLENHAITTFYGVEHVDGIIRYYVLLMRDALGITDHQQIAEKSLRRACKRALDEDIARLERPDVSGAQSVHFASRGRIRTIVRPVIAAAAILMLCFTGAFAASAEFREWVIHWFVTDYGEYSLFTAESNQQLTVEGLYSYKPTYVPSGFELDSVTDIIRGQDWIYVPVNGDPDKLIISITLPDEYNYIDTENMEKEILVINDQELYFYKGDWHNNLIGSIDGYAVYIIGAVDKNEIIQIFEGIKNENNF